MHVIHYVSISIIFLRCLNSVIMWGSVYILVGNLHLNLYSTNTYRVLIPGRNSFNYETWNLWSQGI